MKRFVIALLLLVFAAVASLSTGYIGKNAIEKSKAAFISCTEKETDEKHDAQKIKKALATWNYNKKFLFAITVHEEFSEIESRITELQYFAKSPDFDESKKISYEITLMLENLSEDFSVSLENIF